MSIRRYLTAILLSVITLVTFLAALQGYKSSMTKAEVIFDNELISLANTFTSQTKGSESNQHDAHTTAFIYQIWQKDQLIVSSNSQLTQAIARFENEFSEHNLLSQRWRTYSYYFEPKARWILVAQPLNRRFELAEEMILAAVTPLILSIPILAIIIYFLINSGLRPLRNLSDNLRAKKINDLTAIHPDKEVKELKPVIDTLNQLFTRLDAAFIREKQFASDAAHELRTPLSVLKINTHNLTKELSSSGIKSESIEDLELGIERMGHVVEQILLLNRTNPKQYRGNFTKLNLKQVCQKMIANIYPQIDEKKQDIELTGENITIRGDEFSLSTLVQNLISNANRYSPRQGNILVSLKTIDNLVLLTVEDSGIGIEPAEYSRVFERFYRVDGDRHTSKQSGCGLGLSISSHIAQLHEATFTLAKSQVLGGLSITVVFPSYLTTQNVQND